MKRSDLRSRSASYVHPIGYLPHRGGSKGELALALLTNSLHAFSWRDAPSPSVPRGNATYNLININMSCCADANLDNAGQPRTLLERTGPFQTPNDPIHKQHVREEGELPRRHVGDVLAQAAEG